LETCRQKNGKLVLFDGTLSNLKSSNGVFIAPYLIPTDSDPSTYDASKAIKVTRYNSADGTFGVYTISRTGPDTLVTAKDGEKVAKVNENEEKNDEEKDKDKEKKEDIRDSRKIFLKGSDNAYYDAINLKVSMDGAYHKFLGFAYSKKGESSNTPIVSINTDNLFQSYEFAYANDNVDNMSKIDESHFIKGSDGKYYVTKSGSNSQLYVGKGTNKSQITGSSYTFKADGQSIPNPQYPIYATPSNLGDRILIGNKYIRRDNILAKKQEISGKIQSFFVEAYGKQIAVNNLTNLYKTSGSGGIGCYQVSEDNGGGYFDQTKKITIDGEAALYSLSDDGNFVRAGTTGYFLLSAVKNSPNFIQLRDVFYTKNATENVYSVSSVTTGALYLYGTRFENVALEEVDDDNGLDGLYYKYEGDFSKILDDRFCTPDQVQLKGSDGRYYGQSNLLIKGKQLEYVPVKDLTMVAEGNLPGTISSVYVKSFSDTVKKVSDLIDKIEDPDAHNLYEKVTEGLSQHLSSINQNLDAYAADVSKYNLNDELRIIALQNNSECKSDGGDVLAEIFDEYTKRSEISKDSIWLNYYRGLRDELVSYKVSSEEQNIFNQRLASINTLLNDHLGDLITHDEFFGGYLSVVVNRLAKSIRPQVNNVSADKREDVVYEQCYKQFEDMVNALERLKLSWDFEDDAKEKAVSSEMEVLKKYLNETVNKLKEITAEKIKIIEAQVEFYGKITIGEYVYSNYGRIGDEILFYNDEAIFQRTANKISIQFVKLSNGEHALHLYDYTTTTIPKEFLFRYNNVKERLEKCVVNLKGTYDGSNWNPSSLVNKSTEIYTIQVKDEGQTDAKPWTTMDATMEYFSRMWCATMDFKVCFAIRTKRKMKELTAIYGR
jgi:hypothetical protein